MTTKNPKLWFVLGRESQLSVAEIISIIGSQDYSVDSGILKTSSSLDAKILMPHLGGTIKIAEEISTNLTEKELLDTMVEELKKIEGKIIFGMSMYSSTVGVENIQPLQDWGKKIKQIFKNEDRSVRYVENRETVLSSVTVEKNGLTKRGTEFLIDTDMKLTPRFGRMPPKLTATEHGVGVGEKAHQETKFSLAKSLVVQPFEEWGKRDFGRPARDDHNGMLPPKLATILINLCGVGAKGPSPLPTPTDGFTLLDPFCGSGTVLTEGINLGITKLIGTDLSDKCISDTKTNVAWMLQQSELVETQNFASLHQTKHLKPTISIFQTDVRDLRKKINPESIDAIATEPTLGIPLRGHEKKHELEVQAKELKELFIKAFNEFYKILKPGGKIVFVIPRFKYGGEWIRIDCVEAIKRIGFNTLPLLPEEEFILYARPNQRVGREVWRFQKN